MTKARDIASAIPAPSTVSSAELGFLDGVTSAIQTQVDAKAPSSTAVTLTGTQTLTNKTLTSPVIASVINNTLTSTTGDIIYASAANTPARLGIGSTSQILTVASGIPSWAAPAGGSGLTLISRVALTASSGHNFDNVFSATYENYKIIADFSSSTGLDADMKLRVGGVNTSTNYLAERISGTSTTVASAVGPSTAMVFGEITTRGISSHEITSPFLTRQTLMIGTYGFSTDAIRTIYHAQTDATSFTSFALIFSASVTGTVAVYGYAIT